MNYSCGYWKDADNLAQAQENKMKLIGEKLKLEPGMKVLDIGCGWGALCKYLAREYQVQVVGCTISKEQADIARESCAGLPVDIQLIDYRDLDSKFDRIVSVGMFEHVGTANYKTFFKVAERCLEDDGIFLLHSIGVSHPGVPLIEPWFHKYIFPNGILPYHTDIPKNIDGLFIIEDWHNFSNDYAKTLTAWRENFKKSWPKLSERYGNTFYRMWYFYLSLSIGAFKSRKYQLWQIVLTKNGLEGGYESVR
jgi:cyclopropane-fatty-acyl-phospholipid synthase